MEPTATETAPTVDPGDRARAIRLKASGTGREPLLPAETQDLRRAISQFVRTGRTPRSMPLQVGLAGRLPALVHQAANSHAVRTPYPVILEAAPEGMRLRSLGDLVDGLAASGAGEPETADLYRHFLGRVEAALRAEPTPDPSLSLAWKTACDTIAPGLRDVRKSEFKTFVAETTARLPKRASLLPCEAETARMAARAVEERLATERGREIVLEANTLRTSLLSLLEAENESSHDAVAPERLRRAVGGAIAAEIDFDALSHLLDEAPHAPGLAPDRKVRIENLVAALGHATTFFSSEVVCRLDDAPGRMDEQTGHLADLLRALESARLEVVNRYRPEVHDVLFERYDVHALSADDLDRCPPVLVEVDESSVAPEQIGSLVSLLTDRRPFKVLLTLRSVPGADSTVAALPSMALGLGTAFVAHVGLSDLATWSAALERGLAFRGPSLFAFHAGTPDPERLSPYLAAAVARDGRAVPSFVFDPTPGSPWVDRMDVRSNEQPGEDWLSSSLRVESGDGGVDETTCVFTWLDFAACDPAFDREFLPLDPSSEPQDLVAADQYLAMSAAGRARSLPYVLTVSPDGELEKAVVTARLAERALLALDRWRRLRELGSVDNSFAARALEEAEARFQADRESALAQARSLHEAEMDRAVSALAETIVANIAANLLDLEPQTAVRAAAPRSVPATPLPSPAGSVAVEPAPTPIPAAEPEEEPLVLDEAYIETPRCTSCNECVQLNGMIFAYNGEKQAFIKNAAGGPFRDLVTAAEKCPVRIIHPGKPANPGEPGLEDLLERAKVFR